MEFHDHIWNYHKKCIQKSTNMPGIGSLICEIDVKMSKIQETNRLFLGKKQVLRLSSPA